MKKLLISFAILLFAFYGAAISWVYFRQNTLIYTHKLHVTTPTTSDKVLLEHSSIDISTPNTTINAWVLASLVEKDIWVVFLHGTDSNIASIQHQKRYKTLLNLGISILSVDYPGYGKTQGKPSEQAMYEASKVAYMYLRKQEYIPANRIIFYGEGLGASVALKLANDVQVGGIIVENGATSLPELAQEIYPILPMKWVIKPQFNALEYARNIQAPLLLFHADANEQVPLYHGERIYQNAPEPKIFVKITGKHHSAVADDALAYQKAISGFLKDLKLRQL